MDDDRALLILARCDLPARRLRALLEREGGAAAALAAGPAAWAAAGLERPAALARAGDPPRLAADLAWLSGPRRHVLAWGTADYPTLLASVAGPPAILFVEGDPDCLWHPHVAIVGSRHATSGGRDTARAFARSFVAAGFGVVSGLAAGIDTAAHLGALDGDGLTVAVVATGLDIVYPRANAALAARIGATGAVVGEHPPGVTPIATQFPSRNRVIAGLSLGTLVVEAAERSGALITARLAAEAGREVFALPGSIHNPVARGCHRLIREGVALVESPEEVVAALAPLAGVLGDALRARLPALGAPGSESSTSAIAPDPADNAVLQALGFEAVNLDQLVRRTGLTVADLAPMLLTMELDGRVIAENGRYVRRT